VEFLREARASHTSSTYYLGLGDYWDFASTKEQNVIKMGLHSQTVEDFGDMVKKRNRAMSFKMSFMKPNVLGLIDGNHGWSFEDGTTATEDLADRLGTDYLGWLCYLTIKVYLPNNRKSTFDIVACHGKSGGKTVGISTNQVDDLREVFPIADIYVMGHNHQRSAVPVSTLVPVWNNDGTRHIKQKRQMLCRSGSFKKAYTPDTSSYEAGRLLRPADLGALLLKITFRRDDDRVIADIRAEV
jgi:hypothetical protein